MPLTYLIVLAEYALHITMSEEDITYPPFAGKNGFFPMMSTDGRDQHAIIALTNTQLVTGAINTALTWTAGAV